MTRHFVKSLKVHFRMHTGGLRSFSSLTTFSIDAQSMASCPLLTGVTTYSTVSAFGACRWRENVREALTIASGLTVFNCQVQRYG